MHELITLRSCTQVGTVGLRTAPVRCGTTRSARAFSRLPCFHSFPETCQPSQATPSAGPTPSRATLLDSKDQARGCAYCKVQEVIVMH